MKWFFVYLIPGRIGIFGKCSFFRTGEIQSTRRKTSQSKGENQQNTQHPHMASTPGMESGRHWWKASALTSAPSLPLKIIKQIYPNLSEILMKSNSLQFKVITFTTAQ